MYATDRANPWLQEAREARRRWPALAAAVAAAVFSIAVLEVFKTWGVDLLEAIAAHTPHLPPPWPDILSTGAMQGLIFGLFLFAAILGTAFEERRPWRPARGALEWTVGGILIGAGGFSTAVAIAWVMGAIEPAAAAVSTLATLSFGAAVVALQSIAEEAFFRGWLQPVLGAAWGPWAGLGVAAALFAGLHIVAGVQGPLTGQGALAMANLFLGGLLFGLLALRAGNLYAPAAAHFAWNWAETGLFGLNPDPSGSVIHLGFKGLALWNGGADTMNGSLASTIVLLILVAWLALVRATQR